MANGNDRANERGRVDAERLHRIAVDAMAALGFLPSFAPEVLDEARARAATAVEQQAAIRDLRALLWFSIDNDDTLDLDQLTHAEPLPADAARLRVAVADVDALAPAGCAIDRHAGTNTTSVYTAAGVFPMLPEMLSNGLTSLHEGMERLAVVVEMVVAADGSVSAVDVHRARVLNHAKLDYDSVAAWLDGKATAPEPVAAVAGLADQLRLHDALARALRSRRQLHGALTLTTSEVRPVFAEGARVDLRGDEKNRAKELIADVMIATNSASASFLAERGFPSLRRLLQSPRRWDRIVALAQAHGATLPPAPDAPALERFLVERRGADPQGFGDLSLAVVKLLGAGEYSAELPGDSMPDHFGLAVSDYAHSTAPNRRYPDLVTQRLLKAAIAGEAPPYDVDTLAQIARHCTLQEGNANKVERQVLKAAAALLLQDRIGEVFDAIVTGTPAKGTFARIALPMVEGRVVRGFEGLDVGDAVRLRLVAVDAGRGFIDFERV
jgi:exoribonuclease-2